MTKLFKFYSSPKAQIFLGLLAFCVILSVAAPVAAQSDRDIVNRLNRIENEIDTLGRAVYKGEKPPPGSVSDGGSQADVIVRNQQLEAELRGLTGKIEEQDYQIRQLKEQLERLSADIELRMGGGTQPSGGSYTAPSGSSSYSDAPVQQGTGSSQSDGGQGYQWSSSGATGGQLGTVAESPSGQVSAGDTATAAYDSAFSLLKAGQYDSAEKEFSAFLAANPDHALAANAKYWLGESYYVRGQFDQAARVFAEAYKEYPKGQKAADNLLKLGMSLSGLGKKNDACVALRQVEKDFAANADPVLRRAKQEMTRLGC